MQSFIYLFIFNFTVLPACIAPVIHYSVGVCLSVCEHLSWSITHHHSGLKRWRSRAPITPTQMWKTQHLLWLDLHFKTLCLVFSVEVGESEILLIRRVSCQRSHPERPVHSAHWKKNQSSSYHHNMWGTFSDLIRSDRIIRICIDC